MVLIYQLQDYDNEKNNGLMSFYHYFRDTNAKFYHSRRFKIYIILNK
jgi:hypothetical protein